MSIVFHIKPKSVLDIGIGFGKYGVLCREYLEMWTQYRTYHKKDWKFRIDGIEIFEKYRNPLYDFVYNNIYFGNALNVIYETNHIYDLILLIDILEHFTFEKGFQFLELCLEKGRNLIISTPKNVGSQKGVFGNPHERHKSQWTEAQLLLLRLKDMFGNKTRFFVVPHNRALIVFMGEKVESVSHLRF